MVATNETLDALKGIGLNLYERKIFVALLAKGIATAAEVSEIAKVPRSRSYDVLESLSEKGFVRMQPSKPIKYVALEPREALERTQDILKKKHDETIERINRLQKSHILEELNSIYKKGMNVLEPTQMTGTIKGSHLVDRELNSLFKKAKSDIRIITTKKGFNELYEKHFRTLKKASSNGVKLRIAAPLSANSKGAKDFSFAELKNIQDSTGRIFVVDGNYLLIGLSDDEKTHESQEIAFWADSKHAVNSIAAPIFNKYWNK